MGQQEPTAAHLRSKIPEGACARYLAAAREAKWLDVAWHTHKMNFAVPLPAANVHRT